MPNCNPTHGTVVALKQSARVAVHVAARQRLTHSTWSWRWLKKGETVRQKATEASVCKVKCIFVPCRVRPPYASSSQVR